VEAMVSRIGTRRAGRVGIVFGTEGKVLLFGAIRIARLMAFPAF
jgi:hypothetical protein